MNILQITPRIPYPTHDGGAVYVFHTTKNLSQLGHHISVASFISNQHVQDIEGFKKYATLTTVDGKFSEYNLKSVLKSTLTRRPISVQHRMKTNLMRKALEEIDTKPDVILLEGVHTASFIPDIRKIFKGIPIVLRQANVEYLLLKRNASTTKNFFLKLFYLDQYQLMKKFETTAMKEVDAVTAITEYDKSIFLSLLPDLLCHVSPAGASIPEKINLNRNRNTLLVISNWKWKPNFDGLKWFMEKVWPEIHSRNPDLQFDIIGAGLDSAFQGKYSLGNINYRGFVEDLEPFKQSSTIFLAPLLSGSGMKLKIIEGLASGLPIITTKFGAEGIEIESGTHFIEANTASEFEKAIFRLLENESLRESISNNAVQVIKQKYTWKAIAEDLVQFLSTVRLK